MAGSGYALSRASCPRCSRRSASRTRSRSTTGAGARSVNEVLASSSSSRAMLASISASCACRRPAASASAAPSWTSHATPSRPRGHELRALRAVDDLDRAHPCQRLQVAEVGPQCGRGRIVGRLDRERRPCRRRRSCLGSEPTHASHQGGKVGERGLGTRVPLARRRPPRRDEQRLVRRVGRRLAERLPDLLGDERHERMQQAQQRRQPIGGSRPRRGAVGIAGVLATEVDLRHLEEPVAVVAPCDVVHGGRVSAQVERVELSGGARGRIGEARADPARRQARRLPPACGTPAGWPGRSGPRSRACW